MKSGTCEGEGPIVFVSLFGLVRFEVLVVWLPLSRTETVITPGYNYGDKIYLFANGQFRKLTGAVRFSIFHSGFNFVKNKTWQ